MTTSTSTTEAPVSVSTLLLGGWYRIHAIGARFWCHSKTADPVTFEEAAKLYREGVRYGS